MKTCARSLRLGCIAMLGFCFSSERSAAGALDWILAPNDLEAVTVTDFTTAGKLTNLPTTEHPLYYAAISAGYYDFGACKGGEKPIARQTVDRTMVKILAKQGYLPASPEHPADVVIGWRWGTLNPEVLSDGSGFTYRYGSERKLLRFMGGEKLGLVSRESELFPEQTLPPGLFILNGDARNLVDLAREDLYVAVISAYAGKLNDAGRGVLLWNTRVSAPARGFWLPDALPAMLAIATPYIGRDTPRPVAIRASDRFKPDIHLGDARVVEYLEKTPVAVAQIGAEN